MPTRAVPILLMKGDLPQFAHRMHQLSQASVRTAAAYDRKGLSKTKAAKNAATAFALRGLLVCFLSLHVERTQSLRQSLP